LSKTVTTPGRTSFGLIDNNMPITDPIFIPKGKDVDFPSEFWIIPACAVTIPTKAEDAALMKRFRTRIGKIGGNRFGIRTLSQDWGEDIRSLAASGLDEESALSLADTYGTGSCYKIVGDELTHMDSKHGNSQLGSFRDRLRTNADKPTCSIYVISLSDQFLDERFYQQQFHKANPNYVEGQACYYVGMTSKTPEERFAQHKSDHSASSPWVNNYGIRLEPSLYEHIPLLSKAEAKVMEVSHAEYLRSQGYGVWQR